jgi:FkbM family methyltransferase
MNSQYQEEFYIARYFKDKTDGTFLDIGANDGITFSNTAYLARIGWNGVCVDASPRAFESLTDNYNSWDHIQCLNLAITTTNGPVKLEECSDTLLSSLDKSNQKEWASHNFEWKEVEVEGVTFQELLNRSKYKTFDFISIDAEKHDLDILRQIDLNAVGCQLICIEHSGRMSEVKRLCAGFHQIHFNGVNMIMGR